MNRCWVVFEDGTTGIYAPPRIRWWERLFGIDRDLMLAAILFELQRARLERHG